MAADDPARYVVPQANADTLAEQIAAEVYDAPQLPVGAAAAMGGPLPQSSLLGDLTDAGRGMLRTIPRDDLIAFIKLLAKRLLEARSR